MADTPWATGVWMPPVKGSPDEQDAALRYILAHADDPHDARLLGEALGLLPYSVTAATA